MNVGVGSGGKSKLASLAHLASFLLSLSEARHLSDTPAGATPAANATASTTITDALAPNASNASAPSCACLLRGNQCAVSNCETCWSLDLSHSKLTIFSKLQQCNGANGGEFESLNVSHNLLTEMPDQTFWLTKNYWQEPCEHVLGRNLTNWL